MCPTFLLFDYIHSEERSNLNIIYFFLFQCQSSICVPSRLIDTTRFVNHSSIHWRWQRGLCGSCWVSTNFLSFPFSIYRFVCIFCETCVVRPKIKLTTFLLPIFSSPLSLLSFLYTLCSRSIRRHYAYLFSRRKRNLYVVWMNEELRTLREKCVAYVCGSNSLRYVSVMHACLHARNFPLYFSPVVPFSFAKKWRRIFFLFTTACLSLLTFLFRRRLTQDFLFAPCHLGTCALFHCK